MNVQEMPGSTCNVPGAGLLPQLPERYFPIRTPKVIAEKDYRHVEVDAEGHVQPDRSPIEQEDLARWGSQLRSWSAHRGNGLRIHRR